jgi:D-3-phosphoglycerate dehydrogenase / 2-oxoglutarate reductase
MAPRILVTPRSLTGGDPELDRLREAGYEVATCRAGQLPGEAELLALVPGCVGWLAGVEPISAEVLEAATALRAISRNGTGVDNIDLEAAKRLGIAVLRAVGANARGVAELALGLILALARSVPFSDAKVKAGQWERRRGIEIGGRTVGLIGCGRIGKLLASYALGVGAKVVAFDAFPDASFAPGSGFRYASLEAVLAEADALSLHAPGQPGGRPIVDAAALSRMKNGALLVNTARASLVDPAAVLKALEEGRLGGYATDVFEEEPPPPSALLKRPEVIATPHVGGFTAESVVQATRTAVRNLLEALAAPQSRR